MTSFARVETSEGCVSWRQHGRTSADAGVVGEYQRQEVRSLSSYLLSQGFKRGLKRFESIDEPGLVMMCPVKIVLVLALRLGHTAVHTSLNDLIAATTARGDKIVQWRDPHQPVLCAFILGEAGLDCSQPAPSSQIGRTFATASKRIGLTVHITAYDVSRGAAKDTMAVPIQGVQTLGIIDVREELYHSFVGLH
jgi:hypothetical protein